MQRKNISNRSFISFLLVIFLQRNHYALCGRILSTTDQADVSKDSNVTIEWTLLPLHQEKADWLTIYHQADENQIIQPVWDDIKGVTKFGKQKFNDKISINVGQNNQVVLHIVEIKESMAIYLTVVFIDKKTGEIQGGPLYSKTKILVFEADKIKKDTLAQKFTEFYPQYEVSFDIKPVSRVSQWANILHVTQGEDNVNYGDRNPAVWFWGSSYRLHICSAINGDKTHCYNTIAELPTNRYTRVNIKQDEDANGVFFFTVRLDGIEVYRVQNNQTQIFQNVKFYQSNPWYPPANALIGNVKVTTMKC
ncbi:uncharacterized protein [Clytia hemisphaerica]|uniref:uncharacterized protein n=1 Tax=Clytia hemisphaerica TaxID=252671 RepID=UPI0034D3E9E8